MYHKKPCSVELQGFFHGLFCKNKSSQHRGKEDKAVPAAVWKLPNFAADQEGFGSLSAALAIAMA